MGRTKAIKLKSPDLGTGDSDAVYASKTIVAFTESEAPDGFALAKLQDDVLDKSEKVKVSFLQEGRIDGEIVVYKVEVEGEIEVNKIMREIEYKILQQKGKKQSEEFYIERNLIDDVKKTLKEKQEAQKNEEKLNQLSSPGSSDREESGSESSAGEEEEEEAEPIEQEKAKRPLKKAVGRKVANASGTDRIETEEQPATALRRSTRKTTAKKEEDEEEETPKKVTRATKKKVGEEKVVETKKDDIDESEEPDTDKKKKKKEKTEKAKKPPKAKKMPDVYKKGKWNPVVELVTHHRLLMDPSNDLIDYDSVQTNNKNLLRAVYTKNYTLLEKILKTDCCLSRLHQEWAPENNVTALELAIKQKDMKAAELILDAEHQRNIRFRTEPGIGLKQVDTGNVSKAAFGVEIRKVNLMRGNKEGNNAFTHDLKNRQFDLKSIFELPLEKEILDSLLAKQGQPEVIACIDKLVLSGDRNNAAYLVGLANEAGGFGFNTAHQEALSKEKASELTQGLKKVAVTKKPLGNSGITPLHCAAINPNQEILEAFLEVSRDISLPDEKMRRLIHYAACCEGPGPLKVLLSEGADPAEKDSTGLTPLMSAAYYGRATNARILIEDANVNPLDKTKDGMMAIHWAAQRGHLDVLKVLVEKGVKLALRGGKAKMTPLHFAAAYNHWQCVEFLIEKRASVLAKDTFRRTPLCLAVRNGNLEIASYLLQRGSDYQQADSSNNYPLHYAAAYGFSECIDVLIKAGADFNVQNAWKLTPLAVAMLKNNYHCVRTLLSYPGIDVEAKDDFGRTLVSLLVEFLSEENFERICYLVKERNCDINAADSEGFTPLHYACQLSASQLVPPKDLHDSEALKKAQNLKINLVKLFLEYKADVNAKTINEKKRPLQFAIDVFDPELIETLINHEGIDLAFEDARQNNIYRLLFKHTIKTEFQGLLETVLKKAGDASSILNKEKYQPSSYSYGYSNYYKNRYSKENNDPTVSTESVFTCIKRELMKEGLESYLDQEKATAQINKRKILVEEEEKRVKELELERERKRKEEEEKAKSQDNDGTFYSHFYYRIDRNYIPEYDRIELDEKETQSYKEEAYKKFNQLVVENLDLLAEFAKAGGKLTFKEILEARDDLYNDPRYMIWALDTFKPKLNLPEGEKDPLVFTLISKRTKMISTPEALKCLVDYLAKSGGKDQETLEKYSHFKLMLELFSRFEADFNMKNPKGVIPVLHLLRDRNAANVSFLGDMMDYGVDVKDASDDDGSTPFFQAIQALDKTIVQKLIEYNIDINKKDKKGKAALHYIAEGCKDETPENPKEKKSKAAMLQIAEKNKVDALEIANILLQVPSIVVDIRDTLNSRTPLHFAILNSNNPPMVDALLKAGADGNAQDIHGSNALFFATKVGSLPMMQALADQVKDPNVPGELGYTPLHHAIEKGAINQIEYLLKIGADPNLKDQKGRTGLMVAVMLKNVEVAKLLLEHGANPNEKDERDRTPLHYAVNNSKPEQMFEMEDVLLRNGAQVNALDIDGRSPLHYAFMPIEGNTYFHKQNDPVETVTGLCAAEGVNLDIKDRRGRRPIHYAAAYGAYICIFLIIKEKITFDEADADGNTPLALALLNEHKDTAAIFIQNEAKVTNQIFKPNEKNFLWAHPKDENWDELKKGHDEKNLINGQKKDMQIEEAAGTIEEETPTATATATKMVIEEPSSENNGKPQKDAMEEEEGAAAAIEEEEEDDDADEKASQDTDDLSDRGVWKDVTPNEAMEDKENQAPKEEATIPLILTGVQQQAIDSFFAKSIRRGWQGVAYLLLKNGFNTMQAIQDALRENQFRYVMALMTKTQESVLKEIDSNGQNLFHIFAIQGQAAPSDLTTKIFDGLMRRGVDFNVKDSKGRTPLHYAAESGFYFLENKLLENGCDPNSQDQKGDTPFTLSLMSYRYGLDRLEKYSSHKADLSTKFKHNDQETTPLHYAAKMGLKELETKLLGLGANPNVEDSQGLTPLQKAFIRGTCDLKNLEAYHEAKADLNKLFTLTYTHENKEMQKTYTLLIYAAEKGWTRLEEQLLTYGVDSSIENRENKNAFEIALSQTVTTLTEHRLELYTRCKAPIHKPIRCRIRRKRTRVTPVLYLLNLKDKTADPKIIKTLLDSGVSVNDADRDGWTAVTYAIRRNWTALLETLLSYESLNRNMKDKHGKTPIHHVVNPMDYASYENVEMLELLAKHFDINQKDTRGKAPIYYAYLQDSGTMKEALLRLGAIDQKPSGEIQRQATSIIAGVDWMEEVDYEDDAEKYIDMLENSQINIEKADKTPVDQDAHNIHNLEVVSDDVLGPYSLYMTKVDIGKGGYGEYLFYRMQALYDKNRDNYILFTKWGRIGDRGMHQETPYPSKEECIAQFVKIFKDKAGNEWQNKANFQKVEKKYRLLDISTRKTQREYLKPFDWSDETLPASNLLKPVKELVKLLSDVKSYQQWFGRYNIDERVLPFGKLSKGLIFEAKKILLGLREVIEELEELNEKERQENMKKFSSAVEGEVRDDKTQEIILAKLKLKEKILDGSSRFYELIPDTRFNSRPVEPIETSRALDEKAQIINDMLDLQVSSKIFLGALYNAKTLNPMDYIFEALGIRLLPLSQKQREFKLINQYIQNGFSSYRPDSIINIFALERRGEAERISQWKDLKNRTYLWHGSKTINFMGILSQGLRIAPPEAPATGYMFGKGIYFADSFEKSYGYCHNYYSYGRDQQPKLLLLCEVALGTSLELYRANYITQLDAPYKSVKGCGAAGPDPNYNEVLANGATVPLGKRIQYHYKNEKGERISPSLRFNEFIVYDISQVRVRYLIQIK